MKKFNTRNYFLLLIITLITSCGTEPSPQTKFIKLLPPSSNKIYFSAYPFGKQMDNGKDIVAKEKIVNFENLAKKKLTWVTFSQFWCDGIEYPKEEIHTIHNEGIIPLVRFEPRSRVDGSITEYHGETVFSLENIINGKFDSELKQWAIEANKDNIPLLVDFGVEVNGKWFPWNGFWNGGGITNKYGDPSYPDGPERFRDAYRHIVDIFRDEQVKHITWFFHVTMHTTEPTDDWNNPKFYYPGDDYIDWIGVSIYGELYPALDYWDSFDDVMENDNAYNKVLAISNNKPFAILEIGVTDHSPNGSKKEWLEGAFNSILAKKYINFRAFNYWHEDWDNDGSKTTLRIDSSPEALKVFQDQIANPIFISEGRFSN